MTGGWGGGGGEKQRATSSLCSARQCRSAPLAASQTRTRPSVTVAITCTAAPRRASGAGPDSLPLVGQPGGLPAQTTERATTRAA